LWKTQEDLPEFCRAGADAGIDPHNNKAAHDKAAMGGNCAVLP